MHRGAGDLRVRFEHRFKFFGEQVFGLRHDHALQPPQQAQPALRVAVADIAYRQPCTIALAGTGIGFGGAHVMAEQHAAADPDQAGGSSTGTCVLCGPIAARHIGIRQRGWRGPVGTRRQGSDGNVHAGKRLADDFRRQPGVGRGPGDKAQFRGAIKLHDAGPGKQRLQGRRVLARPARPADHDQHQRGHGRQRLARRPLQQDQELARHRDQTDTGIAVRACAGADVSIAHGL